MVSSRFREICQYRSISSEKQKTSLSRIFTSDSTIESDAIPEEENTYTRTDDKKEFFHKKTQREKEILFQFPEYEAIRKLCNSGTHSGVTNFFLFL